MTLSLAASAAWQVNGPFRRQGDEFPEQTADPRSSGLAFSGTVSCVHAALL